MNSVTFTEGFNFNLFRRNLACVFHTRECRWHFLAYMIHGHGRFVTDDTVVEVNEGDVFFIPKRLRYDSYWDEGSLFHSYGFHFFPLPDRHQYCLQKLDLSPELVERVREIPIQKPVDTRTVGDFYSVLADVLPYMQYEQGNREETICNLAISYMTQHTGNSMSEVARHCHVSETALYTAFRRVRNTTPNTQRQIILCERAVDLLTTTDRPIEEISTHLGFSSSAYFRKIIRAHTGLTPRQIRQNAPM